MSNLMCYNFTIGQYEELKVSTKFTDLLNTVILTEDSPYVEIGITNFNPLEDIMYVFKGTTFLRKSKYILNNGLLRIEAVDGGTWYKDDVFDFIALKNVDKNPLPLVDPSLLPDGSLTIAKFASELQGYLTKIGTSVLTTTAQNLSDAVNEVNTQLAEKQAQLNDININVREYGMIANGVFDNLAIFNILKTQYPNSILYFPRQGANVTYYFSTSRPNLGGIKIKTDDGVIFKLDANPNLKEMQLLTPVIFQNTVHGTILEKHKNIDYEKILTNIGSAVHDVKNNEKYSLIDFTTWENKIYQTATGDTTTTGTATKTNNAISWSSAFTTNPQFIKPSVLEIGACYETNVTTTSGMGSFGFLVKTSESKFIQVNIPIASNEWIYREKDSAGNVLIEQRVNVPNGGAYGLVTNEEQNISFYYESSKRIIFMCADLTLFTYDGHIGEVIEVGFLNLQSSSSNLLTFKDGIKIANYKYRKHQPLKLALVGDSISYGAWDSLSPEKILPIMLRNLNGIGKVDVTNYSISGRNSSSWVTDINTYDFTEFDYVLVMLGTNDQQSETDIATYTSNLTTIANKIVADGSTPIFQVFPVFTNSVNSGITGVSTSNYEKHAKYTQALKKWCVQNGYEFGNARRNFGNNLEWYGDNIHPTEEGQIAILKSWAEVLTRVLM